MKSTVALALLIVFSLMFLFSACQPTPDHDIIVNKAEATIPVVKTPKPEITSAPDAAGTDDASVGNTEQASATVSPVDLPEGDPKASRADIPEHVKLEADPQEGVHVKIDADVNVVRDGEFPVIEAKLKSTMSDPSFVKRVISLLNPGDYTIYERWDETKDEIAEHLSGCVEYDNSSGIFSVDDSSIEELRRMYVNALDEPEKVAVNIENGFTEWQYYVEFGDGRISELSYMGDDGSAMFNLDRYFFWYPRNRFVDDHGDPIKTPDIPNELTEDEAVEKAEDFLRAIGLNDYVVTYAEDAFGLDENKLKAVAHGWGIVCTRKIGTALALEYWESEMSYQYRSRSVVGSPFHLAERIYIFVDSSGVRQIEWQDITEPTQVITEDVPFLNFDEMLQRIVDQFGYEYADNGRTYKIKSIDLVYGLMSEKNVPDRGLYIPLWQLTYTESDSGIGNMRYFFSAIDGSVVEPRRQTNRGGY